MRCASPNLGLWHHKRQIVGRTICTLKIAFRLHLSGFLFDWSFYCLIVWNCKDTYIFYIKKDFNNIYTFLERAHTRGKPAERSDFRTRIPDRKRRIFEVPPYGSSSLSSLHLRSIFVHRRRWTEDTAKLPRRYRIGDGGRKGGPAHLFYDGEKRQKYDRKEQQKLRNSEKNPTYIALRTNTLQHSRKSGSR